VGDLKPANQLVDPKASVAAAGGGSVSGAGASFSNCGLPKDCSPNEFAVHVYSGKENTEMPRICINGK